MQISFSKPPIHHPESIRIIFYLEAVDREKLGTTEFVNLARTKDDDIFIWRVGDPTPSTILNQNTNIVTCKVSVSGGGDRNTVRRLVHFPTTTNQDYFNMGFKKPKMKQTIKFDWLESHKAFHITKAAMQIAYDNAADNILTRRGKQGPHKRGSHGVIPPKHVVAISRELVTYFDEAEGRYAEGHSDISIAEQLDLSTFVVSSIREEYFGSLKPKYDEKALMQFEADLLAVRGLMNELQIQLNKMKKA